MHTSSDRAELSVLVVVSGLSLLFSHSLPAGTIKVVFMQFLHHEKKDLLVWVNKRILSEFKERSSFPEEHVE